MDDGILIWLPSAERPSYKTFWLMTGDADEVQNVERGPLRSLIANIRPRPEMSPWILMRVGSKDAIFDPYVIQAIRHAFCEEVTI